MAEVADLAPSGYLARAAFVTISLIESLTKKTWKAFAQISNVCAGRYSVAPIGLSNEHSACIVPPTFSGNERLKDEEVVWSECHDSAVPFVLGWLRIASAISTVSRLTVTTLASRSIILSL